MSWSCLPPSNICFFADEHWTVVWAVHERVKHVLQREGERESGTVVAFSLLVFADKFLKLNPNFVEKISVLPWSGLLTIWGVQPVNVVLWCLQIMISFDIWINVNFVIHYIHPSQLVLGTRVSRMGNMRLLPQVAAGSSSFFTRLHGWWFNHVSHSTWTHLAQTKSDKHNA